MSRLPGEFGTLSSYHANLLDLFSRGVKRISALLAADVDVGVSVS